MGKVKYNEVYDVAFKKVRIPAGQEAGFYI